MKRNLRTAEERKSTRKDDFCYYYPANAKNIKCEETNSKMDNKFRRPLSNLKFQLPVKNIVEKNLNLKSQEKKSYLKKKQTPQARKDFVVGSAFDENGNQAQTTGKPLTVTNEPIVAKPVLSEFNETTAIIPNTYPVYVSFNQIKPKRASDLSTEVTELNEKIICDLEIAEQDTSITVIPKAIPCDKCVESIIPKSLSNAVTVADEFNVDNIFESGLVELNESTTLVPVLVDKYLEEIPSLVNDAVTVDNKSDEETRFTEVNEGMAIIPESVLAHEIFEKIKPIRVKDASTVAEHQCCSRDFILEMLDQRDNLLLQKIESIVDKKLQIFVSKLEEVGFQNASGADTDKVQEIVTTASAENKAASASPNNAVNHKKSPSVIPVIHFRGEIIRFPFEEINQAEDFNDKLQEDPFSSDMVQHVLPFAGNGSKATLKVFNGLFSKKLQGKFNWDKKGVSIQSFPNILSLVHEAGRTIHSVYSEKATNEMIKNALRNARANK